MALFDAYDPNIGYSARDLTYLGTAIYRLAMRSSAIDRTDTLRVLVNDILPGAYKKDPYYHRARWVRGEILLSAFDTPNAKRMFQDALKTAPYDPWLRLGLGMSLAQRYGTLKAAPPEVARALSKNPELVEAHEAMAQLYLADELYEKAKAHLDKALALNPRRLQSLSLLAGYHRLRGDMDQYAALEKKVFGLNPKFGEFYFTVASVLEAQRQFETGVELCKKAIEKDGKLWHAWIQLAGNLLRVGKEDEAKKALEVVKKEFFFHVQSRNYLVLLGAYDEYVVKNSDHFRIRLHVSEDAKLRPLVARFMDESYTVLSRRYGFTVEGPLLFEMFHKHNDFAVRTIGLSGLGALGACFGKVVTMISPRAFGRPFNWAATAWHEFAHVVTLQQSGMRVPRWFTEGLSEYEEYVRNPCWVRPLHQQLYAAYTRGAMRGIATLNAGFTRPRYPNEVGVCYFQGGLLCRFIAETYGFESIPKMLRLYAKGHKTPEVIKLGLGLTVEEFDAKSLAWLRTNIFDKIKMLRSYNADQLEDLKDAVDEDEDNMALRAQLANAYFALGKTTDAELQAVRVVKVEPGKHPIAHIVIGRLAYRAKDYPLARQHFETAIAAEHEDFHARLLLGHIYKNVDKDADKAAESWKKAKACFPFYVGAGNPYALLAAHYKSKGDTASWAKELEGIAARENTDIATRSQLVKHFREAKDHAKAAKYGMEVVEIDPFNAPLLIDVGDSLVRERRYDDAIILLELCVELKPKSGQHRMFTSLAEAHLAKGNLEKARMACQAALAIKPDYKPAQELMEDLR